MNPISDTGRIVVTGSVAFDYLMTFPGRFTEHLIPDRMDRLSVSFLVDEMRRVPGGCGPNIAYGLAGDLAGPFRSFEPSTPIKDNGILEISTLVAIEAYLIATLIALTTLFSARLAVFAAPRVVHRHRSAGAKDRSGSS